VTSDGGWSTAQLLRKQLPKEVQGASMPLPLALALLGIGVLLADGLLLALIGLPRRRPF